MCYHYSIAKSAEEISSRYDLTLKSPRIDPEPLLYHVNGFDFATLPVVFKDIESSHMKLEFMQWGLVPGWVKGEGQALKIREGALNARAETVDSKPSFRGAFYYRPCLVPATGYFEWMHHDGKKYPFHIYLPESPVFSFAGIWEEWINRPTGEILRSFSIITCEANSLAAKIHNTKNRMPVILDNESEARWLDPDEGKAGRLQLLKSFDAGKMAAYPVSRLITSREQNSNVPEVLEKVTYPELSWFFQ